MANDLTTALQRQRERLQERKHIRDRWIASGCGEEAHDARMAAADAAYAAALDAVELLSTARRTWHAANCRVAISRECNCGFVFWNDPIDRVLAAFVAAEGES